MNDGIDSGRLLTLALFVGSVACSDTNGYPDGSSTTAASSSTQSVAGTQSNTASASSADATSAGAAYGTSTTSSAEAGGSGGQEPGTEGGAGGSAAAGGIPAVGGSKAAAGGASNGGSEAAGGIQGGGATGGVGGGSCSAGTYVICEDFESTEVGDIPAGWTRHGDAVGVADDEAHTGTRALKLDAIPVWERRIYRDAGVLGSAHWGRIFYKVALPVPDAFVHSTLVALYGDGPRNGASEYRVVDTVKQAIDTPDVGSLHQFLYNVQPENSAEFARQGPYDQRFDGEWHCAEYWIDAADQSYALYIDGEEELSFEDGAGEYDRSDIPDGFDALRIGWINYQEAPPGFTAWIDDIAFGNERIGCGE